MGKLTKEDKIELYKRKLKGESISKLAKRFNINTSKTEHIIALIKKHGYSIINKKIKYTKKFKLDAINRVLNNGESLNFVAIDIGLAATSILCKWVLNLKKNGYNIEKKMEKKSKPMIKLNKQNKELSEIEKLKNENLRLKAENEYLKKLRALVQERELKQKKR